MLIRDSRGADSQYLAVLARANTHQPHPQGLRGRRGAADDLGLRFHWQAEAGRGRLPPDDEIELRQLPRDLHPGHHEAR